MRSTPLRVALSRYCALTRFFFSALLRWILFGNVPSARDYPKRIVRDIDELAFLVENILSFNRLDKGRWQPVEPVLKDPDQI